MYKSLFAASLIGLATAQDESNSCILGTQTGCDTSVALGLTNQIGDKLTAIGYTFSTLDSTWIHCTAPCVNRLRSTVAT